MPDSEDLAFYTVSPGGERVPLTFEAAGDGLDCYSQRWRLHAVTE